MIKRVLAGITVALLLFCIVEITLRLFGYRQAAQKMPSMRFNSDMGFAIKDGVIPKDHFLFERDPYLFWKLRNMPGDDFHSVNSQGFRGQAISLRKASNTYRIFCLGDSCTFGLGVKYCEAYPFLLKGLLNKGSRGARYEVVNAGVPGYSSLQGLRCLERDILKYRPDLIIVFFGWNDISPAISYADKEQRMPNGVILSIDSFMRHSKVYQLLDDIIEYLSNKARSLSVPKTRNKAQIVRVSEEDFVKNLTRIYEIGRQNGFKVIFLNEPSRDFIPQSYGSSIKELCREKNICFLDLQDKFNSSGIAMGKLFNDVIHTTKTGNQLIAESIFDFLKNNLPQEVR